VLATRDLQLTPGPRDWPPGLITDQGDYSSYHAGTIYQVPLQMDISQRRYDTGGGNTGTTTIMVPNTFLNNTLAALELDLFIDITTLLHT
jgi:hypothetical protein